MAGKFAVWLRVKPPPAALAESRAIFQHIKAHGRVTAFTKALWREKTVDAKTASYYAVFAHEPPSLHINSQFEVPVYHDAPNPRDEDPFNIRGLQDRKPWPKPLTFTCTFERLSEDEIASVENHLTSGNPYHGSFKVKKTEGDWLQEVMTETGASPGIVKGLGQMECYTKPVEEDCRYQLNEKQNITSLASAEATQISGRKLKPQIRKRKLRMDSLIERADLV